MTTEASIIAQMPTYLSFAADGTKVLDKEGLRAWVKAQIRAATTYNYTDTLLDMTVTPLIDKLAATIAPAHWQQRSDWPLGNAEALKEANGSNVSNVAQALAKLRAAAHQVTTEYANINTKMVNLIATVSTAMFEGDSGLSSPVTKYVDSRFYVATLVTDWDEESAPSPVTAKLDVDQNDTVTITRTGTLPADHGTFTKWRIYRSNVGSAGATFQFVAEVPIATASYVDTKKGSELGEVLPTTTWLPPPSNLQGMTGMANGMMAGFFDRTLCFCEPYVPYAWPVEYQLSVKYPIVGLASFRQNLLVLTRGAPYMASGADSASMSIDELAGGQSCSSARSIIAVENGAMYASPDGYVMVGNGTVNLTQELFSREDWQALKPESIIAALHDGVCYFLWDNGTTSGCYALDFVAKKLVEIDATGSTLYLDTVTDTLFIANGTSIYSLFSTGRRTGLYRTGVINPGSQMPFAWLQVDSDFAAPVTVRWYGDGVLRHTATLTSIAPVRLPTGRYLEHEIEIESTARVTSVKLAGSTDELKAS